MDILNLTPITSLFILILIEKDDGQKKQIVEMPTKWLVCLRLDSMPLMGIVLSGWKL